MPLSKVPTRQLGSGAVLQIQQARKSDTFSTSSTSFVGVDGLSLAITPTSANSKFLVEADLFVGANWWSTNGGYFGVTANGTNIAGNGGATWALQYGADSGNSVYETMQWRDSVIHVPGSVTPITFEIKLATLNASFPIYVNRSYNGIYGITGRSTLTVTEIAG